MISFRRKPGTSTYVLEDLEAGYVREVKLEDVLEKIVVPAIQQADWFITATKGGLHPDGSPRRQPRPAEAGALPADG